MATTPIPVPPNVYEIADNDDSLYNLLYIDTADQSPEFVVKEIDAAIIAVKNANPDGYSTADLNPVLARIGLVPVEPYLAGEVW